MVSAVASEQERRRSEGPRPEPRLPTPDGRDQRQRDQDGVLVRERGKSGQHAGARDPAVGGPTVAGPADAKRAYTAPSTSGVSRFSATSIVDSCDADRIDRGEASARSGRPAAPNSSSATRPTSATVIVPSTAWAMRAPWTAPARRPGVAVDHVDGGQEVGVAGREVGARPAGAAGARPRTMAQRVVAGVRDLAGQREVRAGVVDRAVAPGVAAPRPRADARATIRIAATRPALSARDTAAQGYAVGPPRVR